MSPLSLIGLIGLTSALIQVKYPEVIMKFNPFGIRSEEAVKLGGYIGLIASPIIILFDIFIVK